MDPVEQLLLTLTMGIPRHAEFVERPLTRRRFSVDVADVALFNFAVVDAGVAQRFGARLPGHVRVVPAFASPGLFELRHAHANDVNLVRRPLVRHRCRCK